MGVLFGGRTKREKQQDIQFQGQFQPLVQSIAEASKYAVGGAKPLIEGGTKTLQGPLDFWNALMRGDRTAQAQFLGPELDAIAARDAAARQAYSQFTPRGSPMSARLGELSQATAQDLNRAFLSIRPEAAQELAQIAQLQYGAGTNLFQAGTGAAGQGLQALLSNRGLNLQERQIRQGGLLSTLTGIGQFIGGGLAKGGFLGRK